MLSIDIQTSKTGDVAQDLTAFGLKENEALILNTFAGIGLPPAFVKKAAAYPATTVCED